MSKLVSSRGASLLLSKNEPRSSDYGRGLAPPDVELVPGSLATAYGIAEARPDGREESNTEISKIIDRALVGKFDSKYAIRLGDSAYYLPTTEEVSQILTSTVIERRNWILERYDCDDFAYVLKAFASSVAYINADLKLGLCFGIIWGKFVWSSEFHACNWVITSDCVFLLIEPQDNRMHEAACCLGSVTFVAA